MKIATKRIIDGKEKIICMSELEREVVPIDAIEILKDSNIYVDVMYILYNASSSGLTDEKGNSTGHYQVAINIITTFKEFSKIFWVFDPKERDKLKWDTIEKRKENRREVKFDVSLFKEFLLYLGETIIECNELEAEHYASIRCISDAENGITSYVYSGDSDVLMYGGNRVYRYKGDFYILKISDILESFDITYDQFLQVCIHLGTDYNERTPKHGPKTVIGRVLGKNPKQPSSPFNSIQLKALELITKKEDQVIETTGLLDKSLAKDILLGADFNETNQIYKDLDYLGK